EPVPALPSRDLYFNLLIELNRLCAPSEPHLSDLVIVGLNFRVGSLVRKVCPAARNCSYNFATAYDLEFGLTFFCCQLIVTRHNVSASDCRGFNCYPWNRVRMGPPDGHCNERKRKSSEIWFLVYTHSND